MSSVVKVYAPANIIEGFFLKRLAFIILYGQNERAAKLLLNNISNKVRFDYV